MAHYNKIILIGSLTRDPQLSCLPSQTPVVEFGLAVNRRWRGQGGQQREETCFVDCRAYGRQAETINQYLTKGRQMLVEGRLQFDTWEGKDGARRSKHRIVVERFSFLDSRAAAGADAGASPQRAAQPMPAPPQAPQQPSPPAASDSPPSAYDDLGGGGEDMPF